MLVSSLSNRKENQYRINKKIKTLPLIFVLKKYFVFTNLDLQTNAIFIIKI